MLPPLDARNEDTEVKTQEVNVNDLPPIGTSPPVTWQDTSGSHAASTHNAGNFDTIRSPTTENEVAQAFILSAVPKQSPSSNIYPSLNSSTDDTLGSSLHPSQGSAEAITSFEAAKKNPTLPCFFMKVHKRKSDFFGRADILDMIDDHLLPENRMSKSLCQTSVRSYAICGMGGIGKTQIAVEYAYTRQSRYDAIFFVTADSKKKLSEEFAEIAVALGLENQSEAKDLTVSCEKVKDWLSNPVRSYKNPPSAGNKASWLLILDNADEIDVLEDFWPTNGTGSVIITSRDSLAKDQVYTAKHGIDLKPLSTHDAVEYLNILTRELPQHGQEQDAAEVANKLGGLPLLLTQMAGVMTRLRLSYSEFLALYKASGIEDMSLTRTMTSTSEQVQSISSKIGLDGLAIKSLGLLCLISFLDPDRIPEAILMNACSDLFLDYFPGDLSQYHEARTQLLQTSLINQNPETKDIWVHRLVQEVAREKFGHKQLIEIYNLAIKAVSSIWPFATLESRFTTTRYKICAPAFPSVVSLSNAYDFVSTFESFRPELASATLFGDAGWYRFERGFQEESKEWFKVVEAICEGLENKTSMEVAYMIRDTHHNLGTAAGETNNTKSFLKHTSIWLEMLQQRKTAEGKAVIDYELCMGYNETGVAHAMDGQYQVAITYFSQAIESFQALPHYEDTMLGWTKSNIGLVYWILGDYGQAEQALLEIIDIFKNANGVDDTLSFKTGKMLYALGNVYVSRGLFAEGFEYHTRCLKQYRATLGDSHHRIGDICHRLADDNLRLKNHAEARVLINQALKVFSGRQQYKQELARSTYKASQVSLAMGNKEKAEEELREAYTLRRSVVQDDVRGMDELKESDYDELVVF